MNNNYPTRHELPICDSPLVTTNFIGLQYSVFQSYKEDLTPILINNYINVSMGIDARSDYAHIYDDNWLQKEKVMHLHHFTWHESMFRESKDKLIELMIGFISQDYYMCGNSNAKHISAKTAYKCYETNHIYLIYGYDLTKKVFLAVGNTKNHIFEKYKISFDEYADSVLDRMEGNFNWNIVKFNEDFEIKPDLKRIHNGIYDYVNSKNQADCIITHPSLKNRKYGLDCYRDILKRLAVLDDYRNTLDPPSYKILKDHHTLMQVRIDYLVKSNIITDKSILERYKGICEISNRIYKNYLRYNTIPSPMVITDIYNDVNEILREEPMLLNCVLKHIEKNI